MKAKICFKLAHAAVTAKNKYLLFIWGKIWQDAAVAT